MNNIFLIGSPLDQFEIRNLLGLDAPILANLSLSLTNIQLYCVGIVFTIFILAMISAWYLKVQRFQFTPKVNNKCKIPHVKHVLIRSSPMADGRFVVWDFYAPYNNHVLPLLLKNKQPTCISHTSYSNYRLADGSFVWGFIIDYPVSVYGNSFYLSKLKLLIQHVDLHVMDGGLSEVSHNPDDVIVSVHISPYPFLNI